ncbi:MAG: S-methyl-5-thioribose-1-phosphate isomerase [Bacteroidales bacterium]|nr:S-methyl-5-thioribose-1-phosphate isomerase [Bacteroidales bacterium]MBN2763086.1 S-methyl-5-thioribose-1-phosphate isomerase [Bacteroidales bacterium]
MKAEGRHFETIWLKPGNPAVVQVIDQRFLPFELVIEDLVSVEDVYTAIRDMHIRGAPLIGAAAAFGIYLALLQGKGKDSPGEWLRQKAQWLKSARPTAVNLFSCIDRVVRAVSAEGSLGVMQERALEEALKIVGEERESCRKIGEYGLPLIEEVSRRKRGEPVNILTHCNAGWLACIDFGTATAPVYRAHEKGIPVHVWVDETRPRNQGSRLTAWELHQNGVSYTLIADNTGGHLMQHGRVDMVLVGSDRTTIRGDVANKIGTYLKALAAFDNAVPFYVALPSSSIDWSVEDGVSDIIIEERGGDELLYSDVYTAGEWKRYPIAMAESRVLNAGFDVTPARLVTALITERGLCKAEKNSIFELFPEKKPKRL